MAASERQPSWVGRVSADRRDSDLNKTSPTLRQPKRRNYFRSTMMIRESRDDVMSLRIAIYFCFRCSGCCGCCGCFCCCFCCFCCCCVAGWWPFLRLPLTPLPLPLPCSCSPATPPAAAAAEAAIAAAAAITATDMLLFLLRPLLLLLPPLLPLLPLLPPLLPLLLPLLLFHADGRHAKPAALSTQGIYRHSL